MAETQPVDAAPVIRVRDFHKRYGGSIAARGICLEVAPGEIYGLIGPDGAGKSSLMKALAGVLSFDSGRVEVFGTALDSEEGAERIKGRIGFMPQGLGLNLYPELSVEENVDFFARLRLVPEEALAARKTRLFEMTRLEKFRDRPMKHLSGGMKQKLGLVCTLIHEPDLVILDEPTTGVDPVSRRDFWAILARLLRERGMTALVSTAYMDEASRFHRLSLLYAGRVLADGDPETLESLDPRARDLENVFIDLLRREGLAQAGQDEESPAAPPAAARDTEGAAIEAAMLTRDFGAFRAVDRASFRVSPGEIFGLLGANGAGKTTVIKMLTGILPPSAGHGQVAGKDMRRAGQAIKRRIGYVSQTFSLYQDLTVAENLQLYAGIYGLPRDESRRRIAWVLAVGGLNGYEREQSGRLPMGLRQRLALGCALLHRPKVLFLDEPTSGVDPLGRRRFWQILFRLAHDDGVAILITTHYMSEAEQCDRLALMYAGRIVEDASPAEMKRRMEAEAGGLLEIHADAPALAVERLAARGFAGAALFGKHVHVLSREPETDVPRIRSLLAADGIAVGEIAPCPLSLEDVFVYRVTALERQERAGAEARP